MIRQWKYPHGIGVTAKKRTGLLFRRNQTFVMSLRLFREAWDSFSPSLMVQLSDLCSVWPFLAISLPFLPPRVSKNCSSWRFWLWLCLSTIENESRDKDERFHPRCVSAGKGIPDSSSFFKQITQHQLSFKLIHNYTLIKILKPVIHIFLSYIFFSFWLHPAACENFITRLGIEPRPSAVET